MDIFIYSDESGVFDVIHNKYYVFGGLIFLGKADKDACSRKYKHAEEVIAARYGFKSEIKASSITNEEKSKLFRSLNRFIKFGVIIDEQRVLPNIFTDKKSKQRYLDYAYKIAVKRALEDLSKHQRVNLEDVVNMRFYIDEHTTATNGRYELKEALDMELNVGTYNMDYSKHFPPLFSHKVPIYLEYCDSSKTTLVRAADIVANRLYYLTVSGNSQRAFNLPESYVIALP